MLLHVDVLSVCLDLVGKMPLGRKRQIYRQTGGEGRGGVCTLALRRRTPLLCAQGRRPDWMVMFSAGAEVSLGQGAKELMKQGTGGHRNSVSQLR